MFLSFVVLALAIVSAARAQNLDARVSDSNRTVRLFNTNNGQLRMSFVFTVDTIDVAMSAPCLGWLAFGIRSARSNVAMVNADIIMFREATPGTFVCEDKFSTVEAAPDSDTSQGGTFDIRSWGAERTGGVFYVRFIRAANTGDRTDLPLTATLAEVLMALHSTSNSAFDRHDWRSSATLSIAPVTGPTVPAPGSTGTSYAALVLVHLALMAGAFPVCMLVGVLVARYVSKTHTWWWPAHWIFESIGSVLAAGGFAVIVYHVQTTGRHFSTTARTNGSHQIMGLIVIIGMVMQIVLGVVAHCTWPGEGSPARYFPDQTHWWFGRVLLLLAFVNVFLGIWALDAPAYAYGIAAAFFGAALVLVVILEVMRCRRVRPGAEDDSYITMGSHK